MSPIAAFCQSFGSTTPAPRKRTKNASPRPRRARALTPVEVAMYDAKRRAASGDWENAKGATFVGLYAMCHEMIYGVVPEELRAIGEFRIASKLAAKMAHESFEDDGSTFAAFIRWSWQREKRTHDWALAKGFDKKRLGWKWQFSLRTLTDYRIACSQKRRP